MTPRGRLTRDQPLGDFTWLRVGGPADWLFQPADEDDLAAFLAALDREVPVFAMGVGSNLIVRDGGIEGVVIRLGRGFNAIDAGERVTAEAAALDSRVAIAAAAAGRDLTFLRTIPGTIGGAVRMNAGCYGTYTADHLESVRLVTRAGEIRTVAAGELNLRYRASDIPEGAVVTRATFAPPPGDPDDLAARMAAQLAHRDETQPSTRERTAGSTFRNPAGFSSTGRADDTHDLKAWKLIDDAGMRGATLGGAVMNPKHANFLTNTGSASAADLEALGEEVRKRVYDSTGITLEWEIARVGRTRR